MVPSGVVVFLPSYDYEQIVVKRLTATGQLGKIEAKKKIFREPKSTSDLDKVLTDYATAVRLSGGALLLAVVCSTGKHIAAIAQRVATKKL